MNYTFDLENIKYKCRICLVSNHQMISLTCKLDEQCEENLQICEAFENVFSMKVNIDGNYPDGICFACYKNIKISYNLKSTFQKSQNILEKCMSLNLHSVDSCNDFESSLSQEESLGEDDNHILEVSHANELIKDDFEGCENEENLNDGKYIFESYSDNDFIKEEYVEEELPLTDFVILQVTEDNEDEIKVEKYDNIDWIEQSAEADKTSRYVVDESLDPNQYIIKQAIAKQNKINRDDKIMSKSIDLDKYIIEHLPKSKVFFSCQYCDKQFLNNRILHQHTKICQKYPLEVCEYCDKQFPSLIKKHYHIKICHDNNPQVTKCYICDEVFNSLKTKSYHMKTKHALKEFVCKICDKAFHFKNGLAAHMDTHSKDQFKEICPECGKGFHYRGGLFYHMKIHRGERNYLCDYCNARFLNISGLKKHIRTHTGEKPCQCEYCGKNFRSTSILRKHEMTHTGNRPHICTYCEKGFISAYNLKIHMAGHSGDCRCQFCEKSFLNEEVLKLHMKFKHNIKSDDICKE